MSVLNQSGEEQVECPLCMEPLEVDDLNFFPCTCGYQICRFCWHRIRTDENGLCPACRKAYSEDPADFVPLSREQLAQLKAEKRARDQRRKAKLTEGRKHLASVRVVQRNLVFVVGLPMRLADAEVLKRHEYFGKFGKIHKVVINQSTSYAGSQGPSASAYVTYLKSDDALKAIQAVNNIVIDGRLIKSSLGTTKYCSHFMKNQPCPKGDCMYLHEYGDPEASFTKEQMHAGKHQEYEKKLHDELTARTKQNNPNNPTDDGKTANSIAESSRKHGKEKEDKQQAGVNSNNKECKENNNWPQLNLEKEKEKNSKKGKTKEANKKERREVVSKSSSESSTKSDRSCNSKIDVNLVINLEEKSPSPPTSQNSTPPPLERQNIQKTHVVDDNSSFFSLNGFQKLQQEHAEATTEHTEENAEPPQSQSIFTDTLPDINTTEDWAAAFGFPRHHDAQNLEEIKRREAKNSLDTFGNGFAHLGSHEGTYNKDSFNGFYEMSNKMQENLLDVLAGRTNGYGPRTEQPRNGLDHNMSKFFTDFQEKMGAPQYQNGFAHNHPYPAAAHGHVALQQRRLEEQMMGLSAAAKGLGHRPPPFLNGDGGAYAGPYGAAGGRGRNPEDELDFDPIQETQKAFEEMMACEGARKGHSLAGCTNQMNGVIHSPTGGHLPPPPGFLQPQQNSSHMNSFGSKFLPFLNMSTSQPQQNSWPSNFGVPQQMQQQKNMTSTCNDWKVLDPAILSASSRHFQVGQAPPGEHYPAGPQPQPPMAGGGGPHRSYEYTNGASFPNFAQLPPSFNSFAAGPQNWFGSELNAQITSPPGFRNQQTKQQEC